jgi:hypothetical protein
LDKPATATSGVGQFAGRLSSDSVTSSGTKETAGRLSRDGVSQAPRTRSSDAPACITFDKPRRFAAGEAGQRHKRTGRTAGGTPPVKAPWGVAAAGRVAANNGSALFAPASVPTEPKVTDARSYPNRMCDVGEAREGTQQVNGRKPENRDSRGGRNPFAGGGVESRHAATQRNALAGRDSERPLTLESKAASVPTLCFSTSRSSARPACKPFAARVVVGRSQNNPPERSRHRAAFTSPGAQADSTADSHLNSLARPTEARAGSFANQQENQ